MNNLKKNLLSISFLFYIPFVFCQTSENKIKVGEHFNGAKDFHPYSPIGSNYFNFKVEKENRIYTIQGHRKKLYFKVFNTESLLEKKNVTARLDFLKKTPTKDIYLENVLEIEDKYYAFFSTHKKYITELWVKEIDLKNCTLKPFSRLLLRTKKNTYGIVPNNHGVFRYENKPKNITVDIRQNVITVAYHVITHRYTHHGETKFMNDSHLSKKDKERIIGLHTFDFAFNKISGNEFKVPPTVNFNTEIDLIVDYTIDRNIAYILIGARNSSTFNTPNVPYNTSTLEIPFQSTSILKVDFEKEKVELFPFTSNVSSFDITDLKFIYINDTLHCIGFYASSPVYHPLGLFTKKVSLHTKENTDKEINYYEFGKSQYPPEKENYHYGKAVIRKIILNKNENSIILIGQQYSKNAFIGSEGGYYIYNLYNDFGIAKFNYTDKKVSWFQRVPCKQSSGRNVVYSFANNQHHFFMLENHENKEYESYTEKKRYNANKYGNFVLFSINDNLGDIQKHIIFDAKKYKLKSIESRKSKLFKSNNSLFLEFIQNKKSVLAKIPLK